MLLIDARREARVDESRRARAPCRPGSRALEPRADRRGPALMRACLAKNEPGPYQIQAAINAVHGDARRSDETDWRQILALHDQLLAIAPSPVVQLNRAVVVAEIEGAQKALELIEPLALDQYHLFHAVRAELLRRLGPGTGMPQRPTWRPSRAATTRARKPFCRRATTPSRRSEFATARPTQPASNCFCGASSVSRKALASRPPPNPVRFPFMPMTR